MPEVSYIRHQDGDDNPEAVVSSGGGSTKRDNNNRASTSSRWFQYEQHLFSLNIINVKQLERNESSF